MNKLNEFFFSTLAFSTFTTAFCQTTDSNRTSVIEAVKTLAQSRLQQTFDSRLTEVEFETLLVESSDSLVTAWSGVRRQPIIQLFRVSSDLKDVTDFTTISTEDGQGRIHAVDLLPLQDRSTIIAWTGDRFSGVNLAAISESGEIKDRWRFEHTSLGISLKKTPDEIISLLFEGRGEVYAALFEWDFESGKLNITERPAILSRDAIVTHSPVSSAIVDNLLVYAWLEKHREDDGKVSYGVCDPVMRIYRIGSELELIDQQVGSQLKMPAWGPPRGSLEVNVVSVEDEAISIGLTWLPDSDPRTGESEPSVVVVAPEPMKRQ